MAGNKTALITGITGYIGSSLARKLIAEGWQVAGVIRKDSDLSLIDDFREQVVLGIYNKNIDSLTDFIMKFRPSVVFHVASLFIAEHKSDQITDLVESNVLFGTHLLEAMSNANVKQLINTDTSWQHYNNEEYNPVCLYAATKKAFEDILKFYIEAHDFKAITIELFDTYGPNDPRSKIINLFNKIANTGELLCMSPGEQELDLVYINDVINAYLISAEMILSDTWRGYKKYSISTTEPKTLKSIAKLFEETFNKKLNIEWLKKEDRKRHVMTEKNNIG